MSGYWRFVISKDKRFSVLGFRLFIFSSCSRDNYLIKLLAISSLFFHFKILAKNILKTFVQNDTYTRNLFRMFVLYADFWLIYIWLFIQYVKNKWIKNVWLGENRIRKIIISKPFIKVQVEENCKNVFHLNVNRSCSGHPGTVVFVILVKE